MTDCPDERAPIAIYRIVAGKQSLFLLAVLENLAGHIDRRKGTVKWATRYVIPDGYAIAVELE